MPVIYKNVLLKIGEVQNKSSHQNCIGERINYEPYIKLYLESLRFCNTPVYRKKLIETQSGCIGSRITDVRRVSPL